MMSTTASVDSLLKDLYPRAGERIKQWVVDDRRAREWVRQTCPRLEVPTHEDNCGSECRNTGSALWVDLNHDSCHDCGELMDATRDRPDVAAWRADCDARPKSCADRAKLSDEIEPNRALALHPFLERR